MEHQSAKLFGSLTGDHSNLFQITKEEDHSNSKNLEPPRDKTGIMSTHSSQSTVLNDFSILSYNSKEEQESLSSKNTSSEIQTSTIRSWSYTSK